MKSEPPECNSSPVTAHDQPHYLLCAKSKSEEKLKLSFLPSLSETKRSEPLNQTNFQ